MTMTSEHQPTTEGPDLSRIVALVIDNDAASIQLLQACLEPFGATIVAARSSSEARLIFDTRLPDIVICDLVLPDDTGLEFIRWLRARRPDQGGNTPAIAVTFFYERFGVQETRAAGFNTFIRKPIDPMNIVHTVTILIGQRARP